jgi:small conductance mechanosensitive channel
VLERVCAELRNDSSWSPVLIDGPRVLGVESFGPAASAIRVQLRSLPGRQDDVARELRRRIQNQFEQEHIRWGDVQRVEVAGVDTTAEIHARSDS